MAPLPDDEIEALLASLPGWRREGDTIVRDFELESFPAAIAFVVRIAEAAEAGDHHPDLDLRYRKLHVVLSTHSDGGITGKDLDLAAAIDAALPPAT